jgi:hypothetical protein
MFVSVDISEVTALEKKADRELDRILPIMRGAVAVRVEQERQTHAYNNYTGNLEKSTISYDAADPHDDPIEVHAEMGMHYATHVDERGRTNFPSLMKGAAKNIETRLVRMSESLAKK